MKRTYEEAVELAVNWWADKINIPMNKNNGDDSEAAGLCMMMAVLGSIDLRIDLGPKLEKSKQELAKLMLQETDRYWGGLLDCDYHPSEMLADAADKADIDTSLFPWKTWTRIEKDHSITTSFGYRGEHIIL